MTAFLIPPPSSSLIIFIFVPQLTPGQLHDWSICWANDPGLVASVSPQNASCPLSAPAAHAAQDRHYWARACPLAQKQKVGCSQGWRDCCVYIFTCECGFSGENSNTQVQGGEGRVVRVSVSTLVKVVLPEPRLKQKRPQPLGFVLIHQTDL